MKIDTDVPLPGTPRRAGATARRYRGKYQWPEMQPGDSFFEPLPDGRSIADHQNNLVRAGRQWCDRNRPELHVLSERRTEGGVRGVRVWMHYR